MPVYEYACKACGHHLEVSQSFKDEALTECPVCAGPLRKVFGSIGIVLKGSGFYRTDSRLPAKKEKADKAEKADAGGGDKSGDKGGDKAATGGSEKAAAGGSDKPASSTTKSSGSDAKPASGTVKTA